MKRLIFASLLLVGCAHTTPEEQARLARCARVEVYPMGVTPPRPYRVLGPVNSTDDNPAGRSRALRDQACAMGGDAVMDVTEQQTVVNTPNAREQGATAGGTAIV